MRNRRIFLSLFLLVAAATSRAQNSDAIQRYINAYKDIAIAEMQRSGVPAAIKLAQGIHETMAGMSDLVISSNNHFGIKCKDTWKGESVVHDDDLRGECFRKYPTAMDSYRDHSDFLKGSPRYAFLFNLDPTDYQHWAYGLKKAGYATNPKYPQILIKLIEDYHLEDYTLIALGKSMPKEEVIATTHPETEQVKEAVVIQTVPEPIALQPEKSDPPAATPAVRIDKGTEKPAYPEGEFKLNETRVVFAKKGTSYLSIAEQYSVPLARIFEFNELPAGEMVEKDQLLFLQRKRKTGNNEFHLLQPGESLHDVAQSEAIRLETLLEYNWLRADAKPAIGEKLSLRSKAAAMPALAIKDNYSLYNSPAASRAMPAREGGLKITVQPRETIYSISNRYHVRIEDIVKWNQLSSNDLKTGQALTIYK